MKKPMIRLALVAACATLFCGSGRAEEEKKPAELEKEEKSILSGFVQLDLMSAYVWRNVVQTDQLVFEPWVWLDIALTDWLSIGGFYWQGWDLSSDRRDTFKRRLNESDYGVHFDVNAWSSDDGDSSLVFEGGHEWYTYHFTRRINGRDAAPSTRELYLKAMYSNPVVNIYGQVSWLYDEIEDLQPGFYYEIGFNKEFELCDELTLGLDWNTSFADDDYSNFITGGCPEAGFLGSTIKAYLGWHITDWMSLVGTIAYTGLLNPNTRDDFNAAGRRDDKDILWGGFSLKFEF